MFFFFFSSRRRHTRCGRDWSSDVCSSDLAFRSIETRRPQIRATNTGISAVIDATGEITETIGLHRRETLVGTMWPVRRTRTLMLLWGDWLGPAALVIGALLVGRAVVPRSPRR